MCEEKQERLSVRALEGLVNAVHSTRCQHNGNHSLHHGQRTSEEDGRTRMILA